MERNKKITKRAKGVLEIDNSDFAQSFNAHESGRTSIALAKNIASPKLASLFDGGEIIERDNKIQEELKQTKLIRKGKPVDLTPNQTRLTYILSSMLSSSTDEQGNTPKDIQDFVEWTEKVDKFGIEAFRQQPNAISRNLPLKVLAKVMYGRSTKEKIEAIRDEIEAIASTEQLQTLGKQKLEIKASVIQLDFSIKDLTTEDRGADFIRINFGTIFLWDINRRFAGLSPKLFEIWGKKGNQTELFSVLVSTLLSIIYFHQRAAIEARKRARADNLSDEEKEEAIRKALTYNERLTYIKSRITTDYDSTRQYRAKFKTDLKKAIESYKEIGLITDGYITKGAKGEEKAVFIINENYNKSPELPPQKNS